MSISSCLFTRLLRLRSFALALSIALALPLPSAVAQHAAEPTVKIGSKLFTESVILGEMMVQLVRHAGCRGEHRAELAGTQVAWKALTSGEIDAYAEYTGTITEEILGGGDAGDLEAIRRGLAAKGMRMTGKLGFSNTYAIGMRADRAQAIGIRTISDLAKHPSLKIGLSDEFIARQDGWPGLASAYGLPQRDVSNLDHQFAYRGVAEGSIDVTDLYSTDAEIESYKLQVLEDDRGYFPDYYAVIIYRDDLAARAPQAVAALEKLVGQIPVEAMIALNADATISGQPESRVAADFLETRLGIRPSASDASTASPAAARLHRFATRTQEHLFLVVTSLLAAVLVSIPLGVYCARRERTGQLVLGVLGVIQTLPSMALLVFMIPILGLGAEPAIVALFLYSLLPIVRSTYTGLKEIPPNIHESAEVLGLSPWARLRLIELPLASRSILSGIKTSAVINVGTATIGALIGAGGYGQPILTGIRLNDISVILEGAIPAAALALIMQGGFELAERFFVPQGLRGE